MLLLTGMMMQSQHCQSWYCQVWGNYDDAASPPQKLMLSGMRQLPVWWWVSAPIKLKLPSISQYDYAVSAPGKLIVRHEAMLMIQSHHHKSWCCKAWGYNAWCCQAWDNADHFGSAPQKGMPDMYCFCTSVFYKINYLLCNMSSKMICPLKGVIQENSLMDW